MRISGFNPNISIESFREIANNAETTPTQLEEAAYRALSQNNKAVLAQDLPLEIAEKINTFAANRSKMIFNFVKSCNQFSDLRDALKESNPIYAVKKQAGSDAEKIFYGFSKVDLESTVTELGEKALTKFKKLKELECCVPSDFNVLGSAVEVIYIWLKGGPKQEETQEKLKIALKDVFLLKKSEEDLDVRLSDYLKRFDDADELLATYSETLTAIIKDVKMEAEATILKNIAEKEERELKRREEFLTHLNAYQRASAELQECADYNDMKKSKETLYVTLQELSTFCSIEELASHGKMNNDSKNFLYSKVAIKV